ncbi:MAG: phytanoyl-CoA dioxygenase family protein [Phycisphaeraceae bacterium]|nr:phytanoyl-CoA dioxygenase family protein [Phycisphaeraceae bacterium]
MRVKMGIREFELGGPHLGVLRESTDLLGDFDALRRRMVDDGYLLLRGLIDPRKVIQARQTVMQFMDEQGALTPGTPVLEGVMPRGGKSVGLMGRKGITHHPDLRAVLEGEELFRFFEGFLGERALTFDYKWMRAVGHEQFTGAHYDVVYMGRGSDRLYTTWIPMGDTPIEQGVLAMCEGSHNHPSFEKVRRTYGRMDVDRDLVQGWFSDDPLEIIQKYGGRWLTTPHFRAGDVMIFGMYTMHASTTNTTNRFRLSADVRFQPAGDPVDERWVGDNPIGHYAWMKDPARQVAMETAKAAWGI